MIAKTTEANDAEVDLVSPAKRSHSPPDLESILGGASEAETSPTDGANMAAGLQCVSVVLELVGHVRKTRWKAEHVQKSDERVPGKMRTQNNGACP